MRTFFSLLDGLILVLVGVLASNDTALYESDDSIAGLSHKEEIVRVSTYLPN